MSDFNLGFVIFPGITQLDFTGAYEVLSRLGTSPAIAIPSKFALMIQRNESAHMRIRQTLAGLRTAGRAQC